MIYPGTMQTQGYARIILLVKEGVKVKKMEEFMDNQTAMIWVKLSMRGGKKPFHIGGMYRDHKLLLQQQPNRTGEPEMQRQRWSKIISGWKKAEKNARVIMIGDSNLDYLRWGDPETQNIQNGSTYKGRDRDTGLLPATQKLYQDMARTAQLTGRPDMDQCP